MFNTINGLPVHALVIHAAVVAVPLSALLAILFVVPRTRAWARLPLALVAVGSAITVYVATLSGKQLKSNLEALGGRAQWDASPLGRLVAHHQALGMQLLWMTVGFAVVAVVAYAVSRRAAHFGRWPQLAVCALLVIGAVVLTVQVYRVGDAGAHAVWDPPTAAATLH